MKISVILAHPDDGSFNHAIARAALAQLETNRHKVLFHDLYKENFDPLLAHGEIPSDAYLPEIIREHCREMAETDGIIIIHPN